MAHFSESTLIVSLKRLLYVFGLWPETNSHSLYYVYSYCLHIFISLAYSFFQTVNLFMSINDVDRFTESVYSTLTVLAYLFKLINFMYYQNHIIGCLSKLIQMQRNSRSNENIFRAKVAFLNKLTVSFYFVANCTVIAAAFKPLFSKQPVLPIASWYPLDWQHNSRDFLIVFTHDILGAFSVGQINLGMDSYAYYLMAMITAQFEMLHVHIEELGTDFDDSDQTHQPDKRIIEESVNSMVLCLKEHQLILELVLFDKM